MKLKSKHKWTLVGLVFILSWVGLFNFPEFGVGIGSTLMIVSLVLLIITAGYGIKAIIDAELLERFEKWLKTDDV